MHDKMNFMLAILSIPTIIGVVIYFTIAALVFRFMYNVNEDLKQRKHYKAHPERYGVEPVWVLVLLAIFWPLQLVGLIIYICGGFK